MEHAVCKEETHCGSGGRATAKAAAAAEHSTCSTCTQHAFDPSKSSGAPHHVVCSNKPDWPPSMQACPASEATPWRAQPGQQAHPTAGQGCAALARGCAPTKPCRLGQQAHLSMCSSATCPPAARGDARAPAQVACQVTGCSGQTRARGTKPHWRPVHLPAKRAVHLPQLPRTPL